MPAVLCGQTKYQGAASDLELYHRQIGRNYRAFVDERRHELLRTTPFDTLALQYAQKGFKGAILDTVSVIDYFDFDRTILSPEEQARQVQQFYDAAKRLKSPELELAADFIKGREMNNSPELYERQMEWYEEVLLKARKADDHNMAAHILTEMWARSFYNNYYARSFEYAGRLEDALGRADDDYAYKGLQYIWLGMAYYRFKDYDRARHFFYKGLQYRDPAHELFAGNYLKAWNHLAEYHMHHGSLDSAAYYNRVIIESPEAVCYFPWHTNLAIGNLGRIEMKKGNYEAAVAMIEAGVGNMVRDHRDNHLMAGLYNSLGECYLAMGDLLHVRYCIDRAVQDIDKFEEDYRQEILKDWYALSSKYYFAPGEKKLGGQYLDSALMATRKYEELTGRHIILLGEQMLQEAEIELTSQQVARQRNVIAFSIAFIILISAALLVITRLYRRRNSAYRKLAQRAEEWARADIAGTPVFSGDKPEKPDGEEPTAEDRRVMSLVENEITARHTYRDENLTLESLAGSLGIHRNLLSRAINRSTGGNFSSYVNGYRIREAVRILSEPDNLQIDEVYERVGFGNRASFYRAFRQFTGLSPAEFRKNSIAGAEK